MAWPCVAAVHGATTAVPIRPVVRMSVALLCSGVSLDAAMSTSPTNNGGGAGAGSESGAGTGASADAMEWLEIARHNLHRLLNGEYHGERRALVQLQEHIDALKSLVDRAGSGGRGDGGTAHDALRERDAYCGVI